MNEPKLPVEMEKRFIGGWSKETLLQELEILRLLGQLDVVNLHQPTPVLVKPDQFEYVKESGVAIGLLKYYLARISKPNKAAKKARE